MIYGLLSMDEYLFLYGDRPPDYRMFDPIVQVPHGSNALAATIHAILNPETRDEREERKAIRRAVL